MVIYKDLLLFFALQNLTLERFCDILKRDIG